MNPPRNMIEHLANRLREDMPAYFVDGHRPDPEMVAQWILNRYKPPVEWAEVPPDNRDDSPPERHGRWGYRIRVFLSGYWIAYEAHQTEESRARNPETTKRLKAHMRSAVGREMARRMDPDV